MENIIMGISKNSKIQGARNLKAVSITVAVAVAGMPVSPSVHQLINLLANEDFKILQ